MSHAGMKEEPDFVETQCHWRGCGMEFHTQDLLVKVSVVVGARRPVGGDDLDLVGNRCARSVLVEI